MHISKDTIETSVNRIHSNAPASEWESAMVSGNGTHGAMVFGGPAKETIIVNHERLYLPREYPGDSLDIAEQLPHLRKIIKEEGYAEGLVYLDTRAGEKGLAPAKGNPAFHPAFSISFSTMLKGNVHDYCRSTDFRTGEVSVSFKDENNSFQRRLFVSRKSDYIVLELSCANAKALSCNIEITQSGSKNHVKSNFNKLAEGICLQNSYLNDTCGYDGAIKIASTDGKIKIDNNCISITEAQKALLMIRVSTWTSREKSNQQELFNSLDTKKQSYIDLIEPHLKLHTALYDRVSVDLGGSKKDRNMDIDSLLEQGEKNQEMPLALLEKVYNAGKYMNLCCFGELPPNLQGIWTGTWNSPWGGGYVWDTNLQLAIKSVMSCNMAELQSGFFNLMKMVLPFWKDNAKRIGNCRGVFASGAFSAGIKPDGSEKHTYGHWSWMFGAGYAGWLGRIMYDYWLYTGDIDCLKEHVIPFLKEVASFYEDWLFTDESGNYRFSPACSPEVGFADNPTFEIAIARDVFTMLQKCAEELSPDEKKELGLTEECLEKWQSIEKKLPPYMVNNESNTSGPIDKRGYYIDKLKAPLAADGALKEYAIPNHQEAYAHRHYSHLYPLFISNEFDSERTPELWHAAEKAFNKKIENWPSPEVTGTATATHRRMHAALCAIRLGQEKTLWDILCMLAKGKVFFPSLMMSHFDNHHTFNVDGNGALPEVINRMLVYAQPGKIKFIPALPKKLTSGCLKGIRAKNQIEIESLEWDIETGIIEAVIISDIDQTIAITIGGNRSIINFTANSKDADNESIPLQAAEKTIIKISFNNNQN